MVASAAATRWYAGATVPRLSAANARIRGRVSLQRLSERADLVHHIAHQSLVVRGAFSFEKMVRPSIYGLTGGFVLPQADWSPVTNEGRVLAYGLAVDARAMTRALGGNPERGDFTLRVDNPVRLHLDRRVISIGTSDNWYHFILDYLPRLIAVIELGLIDDGWSVALGLGRAGLFKAVTPLFGLSDDQIIWLEDDRAHFLPRALYLSNFNQVEGALHPLTVRLLKTIFLSQNGHPDEMSPKRIFVSRAHVGRRRLLNEEDLHVGLKQRGFKIIHPEFMSLVEQVTTFRNVRDIVGVHGAGLVNFIWANQVDRLFEISYADLGSEHPTQDPVFARIIRSLGGRHRFIRATSSETVSLGDHNSDFTIDPTRFFTELDAFLSK